MNEVFKTPGIKFVTHPLFSCDVGIKAKKREVKIEKLLEKLYFFRILKNKNEFNVVNIIDISLATAKSSTSLKKYK